MRSISPDQDAPLVLFTTAGDAEVLTRIVRVLVEERLAACATVIPAVRSIYRWEDRVQDEAEALALIKTTRRRYGALEARLRELHPYEVPELLAVPVAAGLPAYVAWLIEQSGGA